MWNDNVVPFACPGRRAFVYAKTIPTPRDPDAVLARPGRDEGTAAQQEERNSELGLRLPAEVCERTRRRVGQARAVAHQTASINKWPKGDVAADVLVTEVTDTDDVIGLMKRNGAWQAKTESEQEGWLRHMPRGTRYAGGGWQAC